jgi:hypothetical protein
MEEELKEGFWGFGVLGKENEEAAQRTLNSIITSDSNTVFVGGKNFKCPMQQSLTILDKRRLIRYQ